LPLPHQSSDGLADRAIEHRPPRDQREITRALDHRKAPAVQVDCAPKNPLDPLAARNLGEGPSHLGRQAVGDSQDLLRLMSS
jgi:hypothetical protein